MKPIIGIVARSSRENEKSIIELNGDYRLAIVKAGGIPLVIIPTDELDYGKANSCQVERLSFDAKNDFLCILSLCDGFVMTGGSRWYDCDEILCQYAYDHDLPLLGICLGMQILANMDNFSSTYVEDNTVLNDTYLDHHQPDAKYVHENTLFPSQLRDILKKDKIRVNSRHRYHVKAKDWFTISCLSEDNLVEGIEIPNKKFMLGVQWHPESMISYDPEMLMIFEALVQACEK